MIDHIKYRKWKIKCKWTEQEYHAQEDNVLMQKGVRMFYDTTKFPSLPFCVPHAKPHRFWGLRNHCHMRLGSKLRYETCAICQIHCECYACKSVLDKP